MDELSLSETDLAYGGQIACEKVGGACGQYHVVSDQKLVRKKARLGDSVTWC